MCTPRRDDPRWQAAFYVYRLLDLDEPNATDHVSSGRLACALELALSVIEEPVPTIDSPLADELVRRALDPRDGLAPPLAEDVAA